MAEETSIERPRKLSTGIDSINRRLDGGLRAGSLVAITTPPTAQSHSIIQQFMHQRPSIYITTLRSESSIENSLNERINGHVEIEEVGGAVQTESNLQGLTDSDIYSLNTNEPDKMLDEVNTIIQQVDECSNVIIDPVNPLERTNDRNAYQRLLRQLTSKLIETDSLGLLHTVEHETPPEFRETTLTLADVVWNLDVVKGRKNDLELHTSIPKNRGGNAVLEDITLLINGDNVTTDDSRNI